MNFTASPFGPVKKKRRWNEEEVRAATLLFGQAIKTKKYPSLREIEQEKRNYPCLKNRSASVIKTWISNKIKTNGAREQF